MKKLILLLMTLPMVLTALPSVLDIIPTGLSMEELEDQGITRFHNQEFTPQLVPESLFSSLLHERVDELEPNMALEGLFFVPQDSPGQEDLLQALNVLTSVSDLQGLEYYSASRGEMRLLFEESEILSDFQDRERLENPRFDQLPMQYELNIHQKDLTFKDSDSRVSFFCDASVIYMEQINDTPMRYNGIVRVIPPGGFQTRLLVIPCEEGLLYYGIMAADTLNIQAFKERANNSFYNRMVALFQWFMSQYTMQ